MLTFVCAFDRWDSCGSSLIERVLVNSEPLRGCKANANCLQEHGLTLAPARQPCARAHSNYYVSDLAYVTPTTNQTARAAALMHAMLLFKQMLDREVLEPMVCASIGLSYARVRVSFLIWGHCFAYHMS